MLPIGSTKSSLVDLIDSKLSEAEGKFASAVEKQLADKAISVMKEITADNFRRMEGYQKDVKLLDGGIFTPIAYYNALKSLGDKTKDRLEFLKKNGDFFHLHFPKDYFVRKEDVEGICPTGLYFDYAQIKKGKLPSEALEAIRKGPTLISSAIACQICFYEAIKEAIGTKKFDKLFSAGQACALEFGSLASNPLGSLTKQCDKGMQKGVYTSLVNTSYYPQKFTVGEWEKASMICSDSTLKKEKYLGLGLPMEGVTVGQASEVLLKEFNKDPVIFEAVTEEAVNKMKSLFHALYSGPCVDKINMVQFVKSNGGKLVDFITFDVAKIIALIKMPEEQIHTISGKRTSTKIPETEES